MVCFNYSDLMAKYRINKIKCIGCGSCVINCPQGFKMEADGKSEVIDDKAAEECGGTRVCPFGAIEEIADK